MNRDTIMTYLRFAVLLLCCLLPLAITSAQDAPPDGRVIWMDTRLRLHGEPSLDSGTLIYIEPHTPLRIIGHTADREWLQIRTPDDYEGWVVQNFVEVFVDLARIPVTTDLASLDRGYALPPDVADQVRLIYARGQQLGNRPDVFTKVGDSISVSINYLHQIGNGVYNLGDFQYLQTVVNYFSATQPRDNRNSFNLISVAAGTGWTSDAVTNTRFADPSRCRYGETPLSCEFRLTRPSFALIMVGTNDTSHFTPATYEGKLRQIIEACIEAGVVPILSTIPPRRKYEETVVAFNEVVIKVGTDYHIPLWDFYSAVVGLPGYGLDEDGVHPSAPANGFKGSADFRSWNLYAGYVLRNLTALQSLYLVWKAVHSPETNSILTNLG
jgi:hypothetical protein